MPNDRISTRQLLVLLFTALLSPAIQALPGQTAQIAGRAAWLSALPALPVVLALCLAVFPLLRAGPEGTGLAGAFRAVLGEWAGRAVLWAYLIWGVLLLAADARRYALRFLSTSYRNAPLGLFIAVLLAAAFWVGRGRLSTLARAGEIFYLALAAALGLTLFFGLFQMRAAHVLPLWLEDVPNVAAASLPVLGVLGYAVFGAFLAGGVNPREDDRRRCVRWAAAFCGALTALQLVCLGAFGPGLTLRMDAPFFMMVKGIGAEGAFERVESVVIALWVLADLALLALLVFACRAIVCQVLPLKDEGRGAVAPILLLALFGALFCFPDAFFLSAFMEKAMTLCSLIFGFGMPLLLWVVAKLRRMV